MITIQHQMQKVDVRRGMASRWAREFETNDIRVPEGWVSSLEIDGRMVSFAFARVANGRIPDATYVIVTAKGSRSQMLAADGSFAAATVHYVMPAMLVLKLQREADGRPLGDVWQYLQSNAVAHFTEAQKRQWVAQSKLVVR